MHPTAMGSNHPTHPITGKQVFPLPPENFCSSLYNSLNWPQESLWAAVVKLEGTGDSSILPLLVLHTSCAS